jgi:hypothetical protein
MGDEEDAPKGGAFRKSRREAANSASAVTQCRRSGIGAAVRRGARMDLMESGAVEDSAFRLGRSPVPGEW